MKKNLIIAALVVIIIITFSLALTTGIGSRQMSFKDFSLSFMMGNFSSFDSPTQNDYGITHVYNDEETPVEYDKYGNVIVVDDAVTPIQDDQTLPIDTTKPQEPIKTEPVIVTEPQVVQPIPSQVIVPTVSTVPIPIIPVPQMQPIPQQVVYSNPALLFERLRTYRNPGNTGGGGTDSLLYASIGEGCTNAWYIDRDCDGYGVAAQVNECRGPLCGPTRQGMPGDKVDADDEDIETNTPATVIANYGNPSSNFAGWKNLLDRKFGFEVRNVYFISLTTSGVPEVNNINRPYPYSSISDVIALAQGGDAIVFREGKYYNPVVGGVALSIHGKNISVGNPLVLTSAPGEEVSFEGTYGVSVYNSSNVVIDGFIVTCTDACQQANQQTNEIWGGYKGFDLDQNNNIVIQNTEITRFKWGAHGSLVSGKTFVKKSVFQGNSPEHGFYLPSNCYPAGVPHAQHDITIEDSLFYGNRRTGIQFNGPAENIKITRNIIHTNNIGVSFTSGTQDAEFSNNILFNNNTNDLVGWHDNANPYPCTRNNEDIEVTNNIFYKGTDWNGICDSGGDWSVASNRWISCSNRDNPASFPSIHLGDNRDPQDQQVFTGLKFRNNIFVTQGRPIFSTIKLADLTSSVIENNIFARLDGNSQNGLVSWKWAQNGETDGSHTSVTGNPQVFSWTLNSLQNHPIWGNNIKNNLSVSSVSSLFQDVDPNYVLTPGSFDFNYEPSSRAISAGLGTPGVNGIPSIDILNNLRTAPVDIGAYEYGSTRPSRGPSNNYNRLNVTTTPDVNGPPIAQCENSVVTFNVVHTSPNPIGTFLLQTQRAPDAHCYFNVLNCVSSFDVGGTNNINTPNFTIRRNSHLQDSYFSIVSIYAGGEIESSPIQFMRFTSCN